MEKELIIENEGGKIRGILHKSKEKNDKVVIIVHGFTGNMDGPDGISIATAKRLCENGFDVYRFNFRFTTDDWSLFQNMTIKGEVSDLKKIILEFKKKYKKIGIIGKSLGGPISILSYSENVDVVVLWYPAPFLRETSMNERFLKKDKQEELKKKDFLMHKKVAGDVKVGKGFIDEVRTIDTEPFARKIKCPILLIHGNKDGNVPCDQSERLIEFLREPKKLEIIEGANHCWRNEDYTKPVPEFQQKAVNLTMEWFKKWMK